MNVGVIGLGAMGGGIARNLIKKGFSTFVCDVREEILEEFSNLGAVATSSSLELGKNCDVVLTLLPMSPFDPTLEDQIYNGLLVGMKSGGIIIDSGNTSPLIIKKIYSDCKKQGISLIDAPVSGGPKGAIDGTLSIMIGGDQDAIERVTPIFNAIGKSLIHLGPSGSGMMTKLVNNIIVAINLAAISESFTLASKVGLDPVKTYECLANGAAQSWVLDTYGSGILERIPGGKVSEGGGFSGVKIGGRDKQLAWAIDIANEYDVPIPTTMCVHELFKIARGIGKSGSYEPLIEMWEEQTKVFFSRNSN